MESFVQELRYAFRALRRAPGFTAIAVFTIAVGIGANVAIFSVVYDVLLRPLPFPHPERLVLVSEFNPGNVATTGSPFGRFLDRVRDNHVFEESAAYWDVNGGNGVVLGVGSAQRVEFSAVTAGFFSILGVHPEMGHGFSDTDRNAKVFVASDALWRGKLGADPGAIGKSYRLDGDLYTLIGVLPPRFRFPGNCDVWVPVAALGPNLTHDRLSHQFWMIGRLRPRVTPADAQAELATLQLQFAAQYPQTDAQWQVRVVPLLDSLVAGVRNSMWLLLAAVGFVLLIACTNVANLLLARGIAREQEFAVRAALGASRPRLLRQTLTEALLLVAAGASLALLLARFALDAIAAWIPSGVPRFEQPHLSLPVLAFCLALTLITSVLVGIMPGLHASGVAVSESLQSGQRAGWISRRTSWIAKALVVAEVALTLLLLSGAGLMLRSFSRIQAVDPGFRAERLLTMKIALPDALYPTSAGRAMFLNNLLGSLRATPGLGMVAAADRLPLSGDHNWGSINIVGRPLLDSVHAPAVEGRSISPNYFATMHIPLLRGREFTDADLADPQRAVIVNDAMARKFWPNTDAIGQQLLSPYHPANPPATVVGVVGDVKEFALDVDAPPEMYRPFNYWTVMNLVVRSSMDDAAVIAAVRKQVSQLDPEVPVYDASRIEAVVQNSIARRRFSLLLLGVFALIALGLAAVGIYGLLAFMVNRRNHEIGVRVALGASSRRVLALIVGDGMKLVAFGIALGWFASLLLARAITGLLFGIAPGDPMTFAAAVAGLAAVALLACAIPGRRAMAVDPMVALRND